MGHGMNDFPWDVTWDIPYGIYPIYGIVYTWTEELSYGPSHETADQMYHEVAHATSDIWTRYHGPSCESSPGTIHKMF